MPRIKRLIQWEGDPNLLPNREKKTNIVYKDKSKNSDEFEYIYHKGNTVISVISKMKL